jgi:hypothetical protein
MKNLYLLVIIVTILTFSFSTAQDQYITLDGTNDYIALPISYSGLNVVHIILTGLLLILTVVTFTTCIFMEMVG